MYFRSTATLSCMILVANATLAQATFQTVGYLSSGNPVSHATAASNDGSTIVGVSNIGLAGSIGFHWTSSGGLTALSILPETSNYQPTSTSPSGALITGTHASAGGPVGFVWSESLGMVSIGDLPGGRRDSYLTTITETGFGVGASSTAIGDGSAYFRAISWSPQGGMQLLPLPSPGDEGVSSSARQLLPDGRIFGRSASGAWLYSESDGFEMLDGARHMNFASADGTFFSGTSLATGTNPAYWTRENGLQHLPLLGDHFFGNVLGMSADGWVIVGTSQGVECVWIDQGEAIEFIDYAESFGLDMTGWSILNARQVSADGTTIVGTARHASWEIGRVEGFVLTIPAPASASVFALGIVSLRRRR